MRLWAEFFVLYVIFPVTMAFYIPPTWMFPMLFGVSAAGVLLLHVTHGFHWRDLVDMRNPVRWQWVIAFGAAVLVSASMLTWILVPEALFVLLKERLGLLVMIALLYPILSALPQELVFRALFFGRYGALMPSQHAAVATNAVVFSLAHLMYWNPVALGSTFVGGLLFGHLYSTGRNFVAVVGLHSLAGIAIFTSGLGRFFYSGAVQP